MLHLFPSSLLRIAGGSFHSMNQFADPILDEYHTAYTKALQEYENSKLVFCDNLLEWIRVQDDSKTQNLLQNFRRDIFNNRAYKQRWEIEVLPRLSDELITDFGQLKVQLSAIVQTKEEAYAACDRTLIQSRKILQEQCQDPQLLKGLALAAPDLLVNVSHFVKQDPNLFKKRETTLETSLLKYISRYRSKTSPFSTFTNLAVSSYLKEPQTDEDLISSGEVKCHVKLNNYLFYYLQNVLLQYSPLTQHLLVRTNPTIRELETDFSFLLNNNNVESFQTIPVTPVLQLVKSTLSEEREGLPQLELCTRLLEYIESDAEELMNYLKQLIQVGFLEYNIGISGTDPAWDESLIKLLKPFAEEIPILGSVILLLESLQDTAEQFGQLNAETRLIVLQESHQQFRNTYNKLHELAGLPAYERLTYEEWIESQQMMLPEPNQAAKRSERKEELKTEESKKEETEIDTTEYDFNQPYLRHLYTNFSLQPKQLLYEDTVRQVNYSQVLPDSTIKNFVDRIDYLLDSLPVIDFRLEEKMRMYRFYMDKFGENANVNILTFYEAYYRNVKLPIEAYKVTLKQIQAKGQSPDTLLLPDYYNLSTVESKQVVQLNKWTELFINKLYQKFSHINSTINISKEFIDSIYRPELSVKSEGPPSFGSFIQFYEQDKQIKGVVNGLFLGLGKMMGRFLYLFPSQIAQELVRWNQTMTPSDQIATENKDGTFFNANLHPPLLPHEVQSPGGQSSLPIEQQLPVHDFIVEPDPITETLVLKHGASGKVVVVHDLCFQLITGRSKLYQLLEILNQKAHPTFFSLQKSVNTFSDQLRRVNDPDGLSALMYPRIIFDDVVILQRQHWYFPTNLLPKRLNQEADSDYYYRVRTWSNHHSLPNRVFAQCEENKYMKPQPGNVKFNIDDGKPQFIDFQSPALINLFAKLINRVSFQLKIVEMLPAEGNLLPHKQESCITEHLVQWYTN